MEWVKTVFQNRSESKSYDSTNGLMFNEVLLPEEVILSILNYVDGQSLLNCKLVCNIWNEIIQSNSFWRLKLQPLKKSLKENLPWYVYYCLVYRKVFDTNLLKNTNGEHKFKHWKIHQNGGNKWRVENTPNGADPLPENVPDFNGKQSCFATSFTTCSKSQIIDLRKNKLLCNIIREFHPSIIFSEWFAGRFDCGCTYRLHPKFFDDNQQLTYEKEEKERIAQWEGTKWSKVEIVCDYGKDIASNLTYIEFYHEGCDTQYWAGHYGSKMAGGVVKLSYDSL